MSSDSDSELDTRVLQNAQISYKNLEQRDINNEEFDDDYQINISPKKQKVKFNQNIPSPKRRDNDAVSVRSSKSTFSTRSSRSSMSTRSSMSRTSNFSEISRMKEDDRISIALSKLNLGKTEEELQLDFDKKAETRYNEMLKKRFKKVMEMREKIMNDNQTKVRFNLKTEELNKLPRSKIKRENEKMKERIIILQKELREKDKQIKELSDKKEKLLKKY